jgi:hypothetical protein
MRVIRGHLLLQEGRDLTAAETALRDILAIDPQHTEARNNLAVLLRDRQQVARDQEFTENVALAKLYADACETPSEVYEHLPTLYRLAKESAYVTEFGSGKGAATAALLYAGPRKLVCYDRSSIRRWRSCALADGTAFVLRQQDVLWTEVEETHLLLIDTYHVYGQLQQELRLHAGKVRKSIVLPGTTAFADQGELEGHAGLQGAVVEFLRQGPSASRSVTRTTTG